MSFDLAFGKTSRDFSRGSSSGSTVGDDKVIVVERKSSGMGLLGWTITLAIGSRIITGKWPWYWFGQVSKRLEGSQHHGRETTI